MNYDRNDKTCPPEVPSLSELYGLREGSRVKLVGMLGGDREVEIVRVDRSGFTYRDVTVPR
jgi:hypothetical protein